MSFIAAQEWKVEGKDCGFWLRQADPCTQSIHIGTVIVAALSAIALLGGVLFLLAQQGYHLGGINSLAKSIHPIAIYATVAVAGTVLVLDIAFICMLIRGYTNQVFSQEEVEKLQLLPNLKATQISLQPMQYSCYISPQTQATETEKGRAAVYSSLEKNSSGQLSVIPFKTEDLLNEHIARLEQSNYAPASEKDFENQVKIEIVAARELMDRPELLDQQCINLAAGLPDGYFAFECINVNKGPVHQYAYLFAGKQEGKTEVEHFVAFVSDKECDRIGAKFLPNCVNLKAVISEVDWRRKAKLFTKLPNNLYKIYDGSFTHLKKNQDSSDYDHPFISEEKFIYITTYRTNHSVNEITEFFLTEESRVARLKTLGFIK